MNSNRDQSDADLWGAAVDVPEWDSAYEPRPTADPEPVDLDGPRDEVVFAADRCARRRRRRLVELIRLHRLSLAVAACFVVAALEMLSMRPVDQARPSRAAGAGRPSHGHALGAKPR